MIFNRERSFFFKKDHLLAAQAFYEKHGGKTIILARFMPILRTFAPVVAGVGRMRYTSFLFFNIFGGIGWVCSMVLCGYFLPSLLNPLLEPVFGKGFAVQEQYEGATDTLQEQRYAIYRDLTSWVASFGGVIRDNSGVKEYGLLFTVTLKAFPKFGFDLNFDPASSGE